MKYRKKPVVIEACRLKYDNSDEIVTWVGDRARCVEGHGQPVVLIDTLEGQMQANVGDWIIQGVKGEFYPCKPDIFEATYEAAE